MIININKDRSVTPRKFFAGTMNENNSTDITFEFDEELNDHAKEIVFITPDGRTPSEVIEGNVCTIKNDITKYNKVKAYLLLTKVLSKEKYKEWRSIEMEIMFNHNKERDGTEVTEEQTDLWTSMVNILNDKITTVDNLSIEIQNLITDITTKLNKGEFDGTDGLTPYIKDGYWYIGETNTNVKAEVKSIISIEKTNTTNSTDEYTITFTDNTTFLYYIQNGVDGKDYILTEEDKQEISDITVPKVEIDIQPVLDETKDIAEKAESIAKGRARTVVKDTWEQMQEWLRDVANKGTHNVGDNLYITAEYTDETETTRQPDFWITEALEEPNEEGYYYNISTLGAEVPDLTNVVKREDITEMPLLATYEDGKQETMRVVVFK